MLKNMIALFCLMFALSYSGLANAIVYGPSGSVGRNTFCHRIVLSNLSTPKEFVEEIREKLYSIQLNPVCKNEHPMIRLNTNEFPTAFLRKVLYEIQEYPEIIMEFSDDLKQVQFTLN